MLNRKNLGGWVGKRVSSEFLRQKALFFRQGVLNFQFRLVVLCGKSFFNEAVYL
jgi:hypothetical protein